MSDENAPLTNEEDATLTDLTATARGGYYAVAKVLLRRLRAAEQDVTAWRTHAHTEANISLEQILNHVNTIERLEGEIEGMQAEGCAAMGALENIFNGTTAEGVPTDPTLQRVADVAARALFEVPPCDHKAHVEALTYLWTRDARVAPQDVIEYVQQRLHAKRPIVFCDVWRIKAVRAALKLVNAERPNPPQQ